MSKYNKHLNNLYVDENKTEAKAKYDDIKQALKDQSFEAVLNKLKTNHIPPANVDFWDGKVSEFGDMFMNGFVQLNSPLLRNYIASDHHKEILRIAREYSQLLNGTKKALERSMKAAGERLKTIDKLLKIFQKFIKNIDKKKDINDESASDGDYIIDSDVIKGRQKKKVKSIERRITILG
mmetsp:Transcript_46375/g.56946  ORF Transcript_46375/g.56946 Transcript_46375/m.56946 type:complete len:180 (+) Transcript_46375:82-621(+)